MEFLVITNNPDSASYRQRVGIHIERFEREEFEVEVVKLPRGILARMLMLFKARGYHGVFLHRKRLNFLDAYLLKRFAKRVVYDFDDAVMYDDKLPGKKIFKRLRGFARTVKLADVVIAGNAYLAEHAAMYNENVEVVPTGLKIADYDVDAKPAEDGKVRLVWIGSKSTIKYLEQLRDVFEEIGRRYDNVVLRIICNVFFDLENMEVEKVDWSLESQGKDLRECDIGLAPLSDDEFTRGKCGFKILQYMSASLPVAASPVGVNSEFVEDGVTGFCACNAEEWIDALSKLIADEDRRSEMGVIARVKVAQYDVDAVGRKLVEILRNAI